MKWNEIDTENIKNSNLSFPRISSLFRVYFWFFGLSLEHNSAYICIFVEEVGDRINYPKHCAPTPLIFRMLTHKSVLFITVIMHSNYNTIEIISSLLYGQHFSQASGIYACIHIFLFILHFHFPMCQNGFFTTLLFVFTFCKLAIRKPLFLLNVSSPQYCY